MSKIQKYHTSAGIVTTHKSDSKIQKYKLTKDTPTAKAGTVYEYSPDRNQYEATYYERTDAYDPDVYDESVVINNPDWFVPIIEDETPLTYPNGAIVNAPARGATTFIITPPADDCILKHEWIGKTIYGSTEIENHLAWQNVFLTHEAAEKALKQRQTFNRLYKKIKEIDRATNWVADWSNHDQNKYYIYWDHLYDKRDYNVNHNNQLAVFYMSEQAKDYMMSNAVSDEEFKLFVGIVD